MDKLAFWVIPLVFLGFGLAIVAAMVVVFDAKRPPTDEEVKEKERELMREHAMREFAKRRVL